MSVAGIGIDVVDLPGFVRQLAEPHSGWVDATFTPAEQAEAASGPGELAPRLAGRFAAKEAFVKAWSGARRHHAPTLGTVDVREIEVVLDPWGRPALSLHGEVARAVAEALGPGHHTHLSLSHDGNAVVALAILETP